MPLLETHPPCVCLANQYLRNSNLFLPLPLPGIPLSLHNPPLLARLRTQLLHIGHQRFDLTMAKHVI